MVKKIAVVGGGSTGHGAAGLYAMKGFSVSLWDNENYAENLNGVEKMGGNILLRGTVRGMGTGVTVAPSAKEAIADAQLISVHVVSYRHEEIAREIAPHLQDGQHILIVPGNLGSFIFRKVFEEMGVAAKITLTEMEGNLFPCRLTGPAEVTVGLPLRGKRVASLPASDTERVIKELEGVLEFTPNRNVMEGAINANNVVMHIATTVLSAPRIENIREKFTLFHEGFTPASMACVKRINQERLDIMAAMGMSEHASPLVTIGKIMDIENHPEIRWFYNLGGPDSAQHRYITEDAGCGGAFALSVAKRCGVEAPVLTAFMLIAGIMNDTDFITGGRTLENLGFGPEMTVEEIYAAI